MVEMKVTCLLPTRLDRYLQEQYPTLGIGRLNKALRENKIKLNGKKQPLSTRVITGDIIRLYIPDDQLDETRPKGPEYLSASRPAEIIYEDDNILIANKPAGLTVEQSNGADNLVNRVMLALYKAGKAPSEPPRLCHRLDTGTSGLVLMAKNEAAESFFTALIKDRQMKKTYLCVTFGRPRPEAATLRDWLYKDAARGIVYVKKQKSDDAREIITKYKTVASSGRLALVKVELVTGRTHQIRAHLASIGCPILGDSKYGNHSANRELRFRYQALCAWELEFPRITDEAYANLSEKSFHAPKPWYYGQILDGTLK